MFDVSFLIVLFFLVIFDLVWKGIALWKASKNNHLVWFVFLLLLNTVGILPIIYIFFFQKTSSKASKKKSK